VLLTQLDPFLRALGFDRVDVCLATVVVLCLSAEHLGVLHPDSGRLDVQSEALPSIYLGPAAGVVTGETIFLDAVFTWPLVGETVSEPV